MLSFSVIMHVICEWPLRKLKQNCTAALPDWNVFFLYKQSCLWFEKLLLYSPVKKCFPVYRIILFRVRFHTYVLHVFKDMLISDKNNLSKYKIQFSKLKRLSKPTWHIEEVMPPLNLANDCPMVAIAVIKLVWYLSMCSKFYIIMDISWPSLLCRVILSLPHLRFSDH